MWENVTMSMISGLVGAAIVCIVNLWIQDKREKRKALRDYFQRYRFIKAKENFELGNEVYVAFSSSRAVMRCLKELRASTRLYPVIRKRLIKAMCKSARVKFDKFLCGNDIR